MIRPLKNSLVLTAICALILSACSKKEAMEVDNETQSVVDYSIADQEFVGGISAALRSALGYTTVSIQEYYFSPDSYILPDGKERSLRLKARCNGQAKNPGSQTVYKILTWNASGIAYTCDSIIITTLESASNYTSFDVKLINGACKTSDYTINHKFSRTFTIHQETYDWGSLVSHVYGISSGTNRNGRAFSTTVYRDSPLVKRSNCPYISSGSMELTPDGFKTRTINFGDGECDNEATFTVNENTVAFKLK